MSIATKTNNAQRACTLINTNQVITYLKERGIEIKPQTLRLDRTKRDKKSIPYHKVFSRVYYDIRDLDIFIANSKVD